MDTVGGDQQVAVRIRQAASGLLINEPRPDARTGILPTQQMMAGQDTVGSKPIAGGLQQDQLQLSAMNGELRPVVSGA